LENNGIREFAGNVSIVKMLTTAQTKTALEVGANQVIQHMQGNHDRGKSLPKSVTKAHPDDRFYTWTNVLINSMNAGKVLFSPKGAGIEVKAVAPYAEYIEAPKPGSTHRAFPFMAPALLYYSGKFLYTLAQYITRAIR